MPDVILASSSAARLTILRDAGLPARGVAPAVDESRFDAADPARRALDRALAKAAAVPVGAGQVGIAADQVASDPVSGELFGKPADAAAHRARLASLAGRHHLLHTAWVVYDSQQRRTGVEVCEVHLRRVQPDEIAAYVATGEAAGCAGGYAVEARGSFLIERIVGDWFAVVGLPLYPIHGALRSLGWRFNDAG